MKDFTLLEDSDQIRSLGHHDRLAILRILSEDARSGADVARELGLAANRVHYHLRILLEKGLIEEASRGRKRWKEERFFRRVARHFIVDPCAGGGSKKASDSVNQSIENAFLDWRREELLHVDLQRVSQIIIQRCLNLEAGQCALLMYGAQGLSLAEHLQVELAAFECDCVTRPWSLDTIRATLDRFNLEELKTRPFVPLHQDKRIDAVIFLSATPPALQTLNEEQKEKLPALLQQVSAWQNSLWKRKLPYMEFALPIRREFNVKGNKTILGVTPEKAVEIFWRCIETDKEVLTKVAQSLSSALDSKSILHLTCPLGTDLKLGIDFETAFLLDGTLKQKDRDAGRIFVGLPAGTLNFFPRDNCVNGTFRADYTYQGGKHIEGVTLHIENNRIVSFSADHNESVLKQRIAAATGDADLIAGIGFGLNPAGQGPTGKPILDACLQGAITLHFGNNELQGGKVRSTINLILPACHLSANCGSRQIIVDGQIAPHILYAGS
jgi:leucyl aminopeptidase (aminopeptidase T)